MTRTASDFLGSLEVPEETLYGIHSLPTNQSFGPIGMLKQAYFMATVSLVATYMSEPKCSVHTTNSDLRFVNDELLQEILRAATILKQGFLFKDI